MPKVYALALLFLNGTVILLTIFFKGAYDTLIECGVTSTDIIKV